MRVDLLVLFTSCALVVCASDASGNPITPHDKTNIQSLAESQEGIPVKRLLSTKKTKNDEERGPFDRTFQAIKDKFLSREDLLKQILTSTDGSVVGALQHEKMTSVIKAYEKDPYELVKKLLSNKKIEEKQLALALHEYSKVKRGDGYGLIDALFTHHPDGTKHDYPVARAFEILMKKNPDESNDLFTMSIEEIKALDSYIQYRLLGISNEYGHDIAESMRLRHLILTLVRAAESEEKVVSMIARHHTEPGAKLLEEVLYQFLLKSAGSEEKVVKRLFTFSGMEIMGVKLLTSQELDMLHRFYLKATVSKVPMPEVTTKVMALRKAFDDDRKVALLISKAMEDQDEAIRQVSQVLETEYFKQLQKDPTREVFEKKVLEELDDHDHDLVLKFVKRFRDFDGKER